MLVLNGLLPAEFYPSGQPPKEDVAAENEQLRSLRVEEPEDPGWRSPRAEEPEEAVCFICLDGEGPLVSNICACRNTCVHRRCLLELLKRQSSASSTGPPSEPRCSVCHAPYLGVDDWRPLEESERPSAPAAVDARRLQVATAGCYGVSVLSFALGMVSVSWALHLGMDSPACTLLILAGVLLVLHAWYLAKHAQLHARVEFLEAD